eukprot:scaffold24587_cov18-Tisochrysis_lutea.AAC.1
MHKLQTLRPFVAAEATAAFRALHPATLQVPGASALLSITQAGVLITHGAKGNELYSAAKGARGANARATKGYWSRMNLPATRNMLQLLYPQLSLLLQCFASINIFPIVRLPKGMESKRGSRYGRLAITRSPARWHSQWDAWSMRHIFIA